jgi:hypothetical protein
MHLKKTPTIRRKGFNREGPVAVQAFTAANIWTISVVVDHFWRYIIAEVEGPFSSRSTGILPFNFRRER